MSATSRLYDALSQFLRQSQTPWQDARHLQTLCWMMVGMIASGNVHLNGFGVHILARAQFAQSHQRRFRRWLANRRIPVAAAHHALMSQALSNWGKQRLYLSLDTTVLWNCFCIVWVGVVYRGRTIPIAWRVVAQSSSTVRLWTVQRVLRQAQRVLPQGCGVVLLADRGFADGKLFNYLRGNLGWHFRIRIKRSFQFQYQGQWHKVSSIVLKPGQAYFCGAVAVGKTRPCSNLYLALAQDELSGEVWTIVSDEVTNLQTCSSVSSPVSGGGIVSRPQVERIQSGGFTPAGQVCLDSVVGGDCFDDAVSGAARSECGDIGQTSLGGSALAAGDELSEAGLELD